MKGLESSKEKYSMNIVRSGKVYRMVQPSLETLSPTSLGLQFRHLLNSHQSKPRLRSPPDFHWQVGKDSVQVPNLNYAILSRCFKNIAKGTTDPWFEFFHQSNCF